MTPKTTAKTRKPRTVKVSSTELPKNPFAFEILDLVSKQRTKAKKVALLQRYGDLSLKQILKWNYDTTIISALPEGEVPYGNFEDDAMTSGTLTTAISFEVRRMHETGSFSLGSSDKQGHTTIRREAKHFYHFVQGGNPAMNMIRRETMFINILEGLHPLEAEIVTLCKDKRLGEVYKITKDVVSEAYPDIQWGNRG